MTDYSTCRFCRKSDYDNKVKYAVRHYAHFRCYLASGRTLSDLHDWQVVEFPALLLKEFELMDIAAAAYNREKERMRRERKMYSQT